MEQISESYQRAAKAKAAEMRRLAEKGETFREIGKRYGISHQRVHQLVGSGINPRGRRPRGSSG